MQRSPDSVLCLQAWAGTPPFGPGRLRQVYIYARVPLAARHAKAHQRQHPARRRRGSTQQDLSGIHLAHLYPQLAGPALQLVCSPSPSSLATGRCHCMQPREGLQPLHCGECPDRKRDAACPCGTTRDGPLRAVAALPLRVRCECRQLQRLAARRLEEIDATWTRRAVIEHSILT